MPNYKLFKSFYVLAITMSIVGPGQMQEMPEYDDYPAEREPPPGPGGMGGPEGMDGPGGMDGPDGPDYPDYPRRPPYGRGRDPYGDYGRGGRGVERKNEVVVGRKRFKLYEKKRLNHKRAKEFCRRKEGKLAEANTLEEMRRLEKLFMRARMLGMDVWVGADKKKWKKHSMKEVTHPGLNLNKSEMEKSGIKASLVGGGMKEMCPAISLSTRNLGPVQCQFPLPFICEYDRDRPRTTRPPKRNSTTKASKGKKESKKRKFPGKDEMKK